MNKQNKKGSTLLPEQTVKIIITLLVLGGLIFLLTSLYFSKVRTAKQEQAEAELKTGGNPLIKVIQNLSVGESKPFLLKTPTDWYLFGFSHTAQKGKQPAKCGLEKCLCICENVWGDERQIKYCQNYGVCINVPNLKTYIDELEIYISASKPPTLNIMNDNGVIKIN